MGGLIEEMLDIGGFMESDMIETYDLGDKVETVHITRAIFPNLAGKKVALIEGVLTLPPKIPRVKSVEVLERGPLKITKSVKVRLEVRK